MPRNLRISETFFRAGFVEYWGSGIRRISDACKSYGSPIPEIVNEAGGVVVKCKPSESYLKALMDENKNFVISKKTYEKTYENTGHKKIKCVWALYFFEEIFCEKCRNLIDKKVKYL